MTPQQLHNRRKLKARRKQIQRKLRKELANPNALSARVLQLDKALDAIDAELNRDR